jgi:hypothetical protein
MTGYTIEDGACEAAAPEPAPPMGSFIPGANCSNPVFQSRAGNVSTWVLQCTMNQGWYAVLVFN